jgi:hypothetical protein
VRRLIVVAAVLAAGVAPPSALAVDHVSLNVLPSRLGGGADWYVRAYVPAIELYGGRELLGVTLTRTFRSGTAEESHALRASLETKTISFDGRRGVWNVRRLVGPVLSANMAIVATGPARPMGSYVWCSGAFAQVPVSLRGTFVLRTGTTFFGNVRRVRLRGIVTFNQNGAVDCARTAPAACSPSTTVMGSNRDGVHVTASPSWFGLQVREPIVASTAAWYHVFGVTTPGTFAPALPQIDVRAPPAVPIQGAGTFTAREPATASSGPCKGTATSGVFNGSFSVRYTGWGARTFEFADDFGTYSVVP